MEPDGVSSETKNKSRLERKEINRKNDEDFVRFYQAQESNEIVKTRVLSYTFDTDDEEDEGGCSLGPLSASHKKQTVGLPQNYEEDCKYDKYIQDMDGYDVRIDNSSEDEASEQSSDDDSDDDDDAKKTSPPPAAPISNEAHMNDMQLSITKVGQSSQPSPKTGMLLPLHDTKGVYLLTFDGYYTKNRSQGENGGYGALLRCGDGTPVAALAGGSKLWISKYFHTLEGLQCGLDLAISRDIEALYCVCNSQRACETLMDCFINNDEGECPYHPNNQFDIVCRPCLQSNLRKGEPFHLVYELLREIVQKGQRYYRCDEGLVESHVKEWNKPANFLAKFERRPGVEKELAPEEFTDDLQAFVNQHGGRNPFIYN